MGEKKVPSIADIEDISFYSVIKWLEENWDLLLANGGIGNKKNIKWEWNGIGEPPKVKSIDAYRYYNGGERETYYVIESLELSESAKKISSRAFFISAFDGLHRLVIPKSIESIEEFVSDNRRRIDEIVISASAKGISPKAFPYRIKKMTITYDSYDELVDFILNNKNLMQIMCFKDYDYRPKNPDVTNVVFEGPILSNKQKKELKKYLLSNKRYGKLQISFSYVTKSLEEKQAEKSSDISKDIQDLLDEIEKVCLYFSPSFSKEIDTKVNALLSKYKSDLEKLKPKYGESDSDLLKIDVPAYVASLKPTLIADLENILMGLTIQKASLEFLKQLNGFKKLISTKVSEEVKGDSIESKIKNIIYYAGVFGGAKENVILSKLSMLIDEAISKESSSIDRKIQGNGVQLTKEVSAKSSFDLGITALNEEVRIEVQKVKPFKDLLDCLENNNAKLSDGYEIGSIIGSTKYVISKIRSEKYRAQLEKKLSQLLKKYSDIIKNIITNGELLKTSKYHKIEENLRRDLQVLLEEVNKIVQQDSYQLNNANKNNILAQLTVCKDIIAHNQVLRLTKEIELQPISEYVLEINNKLQGSNIIDSKVKLAIKQDLLSIIDKCVTMVSDKEVDTIEEYFEIVQIIMKQLVEIELKLDTYIKNLEEYNKYSK